MVRAFSGFIHEHQGEPYWYRQEFYGKRDDGSRFVGVLFLCRGLPAELAPYRERFRSHSFGEDEVLCVASGCVVPQTESSGDAFDLRGLTAYWYAWNLDIEDVHFLLKGIADVRRKTGAPALDQEHPQPPPLPATGIREMGVEEVCSVLVEKQVLIFTGAGISTAGGFPDAATFWPSLGLGGDQPVSGFIRDVFECPPSLVERIEAIYRAKPTPAHWALKRLQDRFGLAIWSGNFDGLHEASGTRIRFVTSTDEKFTYEELRRHDVVLTVGVSQFGFGNFAAAYREARPDGRIIAINPELPPYLVPGDGLVRAGCQEVLPDIARRLLG